jgi:hypothetical protein
MPAWSNTDAPTSKPKFDVERQTREVTQLTVATGNTAGNNILTFTYYDGTASSNLSNVIVIGQYVYGTNVSANGIANFFKSNNTVSAISGNTVTLTNPIFGTVSTGAIVEVDKAIALRTNNVANTYNQDTILITPTRVVNSNNIIANTGNFSAGWVHVQKKVNSDGTVRYLKETLVALANPVASNTSSGNTSFGQIVSGV